MYKMNLCNLRAILLLVLQFISIYAANDGNCQLEGIDWVSNLYTNEVVDDTAQIEVKFPYEGTLSVEIVDSTYLDVLTDGQYLIFQSNSKFAEFDANTATTDAEISSFSTNVKLTCSDGVSFLTFLQTVRDTNNNPPKFSESIYEYTVPMPLLPLYDITSLGTTITVTDLDFSNQDIIFDVTPKDNFLIETVNLGDKQFKAIVKVSSATRLNEDSEFTISATDKGVGDDFKSQTTTATFKIIIDKDSSLADSLTFNNPLCQYEYGEENGKPTLTLITEPIKLITDSQDVIVVALDNNDFEAKIDQDSKEIAVTVTNQLDNAEPLVLTLSANFDGSDQISKAAILISFPAVEPVVVPKFEEPYYLAVYTITDNQHKITLNNTITLTDYTEQVTLSLTGVYSENFNLKNLKENSWDIELTKDLDEEIWKEKENLLLVLEANIPNVDEINTATLIIQLPENSEIPLEFEQIHYSAKYVVNNEIINIELEDGPIQIINNLESDITFILVDNFTDNFEFTYEASEQLTIKKPLDPEILQNEKEILLTLQALVADESFKVSTTILVKLPEIEIPQFSQSSYTIIYNSDNTVDLNGETISLLNDNKNDIRVSFIDNFSENFDIKLNTDTNSYEISVEKNLDTTIIDEEYEILATLEATYENSPLSGYATVLIKLPLQEALPVPEFTETTYIALYVISENSELDSIEMDPILIEGEQEELTTVTLFGNFSENFNILRNNQECIVEVTTNLDDDILKNEKELILNLEAKLDGSSKSNFATFIVRLPKFHLELPPKFSEAYYQAYYKLNEQGGNDLVELKNDIKIDDDKGEINLIGDLANNFKLNYNTENSYWEILVETNLDSNILETETEIVLILEASLENIVSSTSVVIIALPEKLTTPTFSRIYYVAHYNIDENNEHSVDSTENPIELNGNTNGVTINLLGNFSDNFELILNENENNWILNLKKKLNENILENESEIILELEAKITGQSEKESATLIIILPKPRTDNLKFSETYYEFNYKIVDNSKDTLESNQTISLTSEDGASLTLTLSGSFSEYFAVTLDPEALTCQVNLIKNLDSQILQDNEQLILTLDADDTKITVSTVLIIILPDLNDLEDDPKFSEAYYEANYIVKDIGDDEIELKQEITFINDDLENIATKLSGSYSEYFKVNWDYNSKTCNINVEKNLNLNDLEQSELFLVIEAENSENDKDLATLVIKLPGTNLTDNLEFAQPYYTANYRITNSSDEITLDEEIKLNSDDPENIVITIIGNYSEHFQLNYDEETKSYNLDIVKNIEFDVTNQELVLKIEAKSPENTEVATATLVIVFPKTQKLRFEDSYYLANYHENTDQDYVDLVKPIKLESDDVENILVNLIGQYSEYFKITQKNAGEYDVELINNLDLDKISDEIILTLQAEISDNPTQTVATLIIYSPNTEISDNIKFNSAFYEALYTIEDNQHKIEMKNDNIKLNTNKTNIHLIIEGQYSDNFNVESVEDEWILTLNKGLDENILDENFEILLTLKAESSGIEDLAAVVIELPKASYKPIKFNLPYYDANYLISNQSHSVEMHNSISIETESTELVTIELIGNLSNNFKLVKQDEQWIVQISHELDEDILNTGLPIILSIKAAVSSVSTEVPLIIQLPLPATLEIPVFSSILYLTDYLVDNDVHSITNTEITIENAEKKNVNVVLTGVYGSNFLLTQKSDNIFVLEIAEELDENIFTTTEQLILKLEANFEDQSSKAYASLLIKLPEENATVIPEFSESYYIANYTLNENGLDNLVFEQPITLKNNFLENTEISLVGEYQTYFELVQNGDNQWTVEVLANLDNNTLNGGLPLVLLLLANFPDSSNQDTATLIIQLPLFSTENSPKFSSLLYEANYKIDDNLHSIESPDIILDDNNEDKNIELDLIGDFSNNFKLTSNSKNSFKLEIDQNLDENILDNNDLLILTLQANFAESSTKIFANLIVYLPEKNASIIPKFSAAFYTGNYSQEENENDCLELDNFIELTDDYSKDPTFEIVGEYEKNFRLVKIGDNQWNVEVYKNLDDDILKSSESIIFTVLATFSDEKDSNYATVIVRLPKSDLPQTPKFEQSYYTANYILTDDLHILEINKFIKVNPEEAKVTLTGDYASNFVVKLNAATQEWNIELTTNLDENVLTENKHLLLELQAKIDLYESVGTATLIVILPETTLPNFDQMVYNANYTITDHHEITTETITLTDESAQINIIGEFVEYFQVNCEDNQCDVSLLKPLADEILLQETQISLVLEASRSDTNLKNYAIIIVKLPLQIDGTYPVFSQNYYKATYQVNEENTDTVDISGEQITLLEEDLSTAKITLDGDESSYFGLTFSNTYWKLSLKSDLPENILKTKSSIILTIKATVEDKPNENSVPLIIQLPKSNYTVPVKFSNNFYEAEYKVKDEDKKDELDFDEDIEFTTENNQDIQLEITGKYREYFTYTQDSDRVIIKLVQDLDEDILKNEEIIILTMSISLKNDDGKSNSVVVIKLPKIDDNPHAEPDEIEGYIIAISVLSIILFIFIIAILLFYYFKLRRSPVVLARNGDTEVPKFAKNSNPTNTNTKIPDIASRRPTTGIRYSIQDNLSDESSTDDIKERRKSVTFDENVDEIKIDRPEDDYDEITNEDSKNGDNTKL